MCAAESHARCAVGRGVPQPPTRRRRMLSDEKIESLREAAQRNLSAYHYALVNNLIAEIRASRAARAESEGTPLPVCVACGAEHDCPGNFQAGDDDYFPASRDGQGETPTTKGCEICENDAVPGKNYCEICYANGVEDEPDEGTGGGTR